jgi:hypothetical protein
VSSTGPRDTTAFEVREALSEPGCAICRLALRSVVRLMTSIAYEQVNDIGMRNELRRAHGFCNQHAFQWLREARSVLGTALIYRDVLQSAMHELESRGDLLRSFARRGQRERGCPACRTQSEAEARYVETLLALVADDAGARSALEASDGLCRRHALAAVRLGRAGSEHVAQRTRQVVEALVHDLDEIIRKEDYRFRHEARTEDERTAPARAIGWAAGADGLVS